MAMGQSSENYLETILVLQKRGGEVRSIDVAAELGFSKPSVSIAVRHLRESGYLTVSQSGALELTGKGLEIAESTYSRHILLRDWLISLGVDEKTASNDACRIEHVISEQSVVALRNYLKLAGDKAMLRDGMSHWKLG
ncbi:MAG: metal-dependent transcriptional regulator [Oscillospiraceae bacterium]|nr:metal-dependent transcriptional regulator [Oscillospiraceae bacterium]